MEKIKSIEVLNNVNKEGQETKDNGYYGGYDGYKVTTTDNVYYILISNGQSCCEDWGYFDTNDNSQDFIGATLVEIKFDGERLSPMEEDVYEEEYWAQFVDFRTTEGVFQLAVYNNHNGYYGHGIYVLKNKDVLISDVL